MIGAYIEYMCGYYDVKGFEDIKIGMGGSKFVTYFNHHWDEALQRITVQNVLYKFFVFIKDTYSIYNPELLKKLGRK